ncbi:putative ribonuclease H-like domain-containing protein [Tanacetum coccineum]
MFSRHPLEYSNNFVVCGTVGSQKSSLMSCILGEVSKVSRSVKVEGTKAYVAQSPWIQSGKIEDNILFRKEMDRERYDMVLEACSLKKDLEILSFCDQTVIGEREINLSGDLRNEAGLPVVVAISGVVCVACGVVGGGDGGGERKDCHTRRLGYSTNSKAFRVFNSRTRIVEENLHVQFSTKACDDAGKARIEIVPGKYYILLPLWTTDSPFSQNTKNSPSDAFKPSGDDGKKDDENPRIDSEDIDQEKEDDVNSTNNVNAANTNEVNDVGAKTSIELLDDPNMPHLEDIIYSDDDEDVGAEADMNNLDTTMPVSPILTTRVHKDNPVEQIIRDLNSAPQTRRMTKNLEAHGLFSSVQQRTNHKDFQNCLFACFLSQEEPKKMDVKSAFLYGKIKEEVYVCQPPGFEDPDFPNRRGRIDKTLFIRRDKGDILLVQVYVDDIIFGSTKKSLCTEFEKMMRKKFQMSSMGELIFFLGLQVKQKEDGIFISQDKYVIEILKKFSFTDVKTASTPMETQKPLIKDEDCEEADVHLYRSMIGSLMYLTSSRPDIIFAVCACARYQVKPKMSHLHAVKRIFRYLKGQPKLGLWYPKDSPFDLVAYTDSDYARASLDRKSTTGGCQFFGCRLISWQCKKQTVVANSTTEAEYVAALSCCGQVLWIQNQLLDYGDSNEKKLIQMIKIHTDKNVADLLTKSFDDVWNGMENLLWMEFNLWMEFKLVLLQALVDRKKVISTESTIRRDLQLEDAEGMDCLPTATIFEELTRMGAKTIAWNEFSSTMASAIICLATNQKFNFSKYIFDNMVKNVDSKKKQPRRKQRKDTEVPQPRGPTKPITDETKNEENVPTHSNDPLLSGEDSIKLNELTELCTKLQQRVLDLEHTKTTQALKIKSLKRRVKKFEKKKKSRTHGLKRLYKVGLSAKIVSSEDEDEDMFGVNDLEGDEVVVESDVAAKKKDDEVNIVEEVSARPKSKGIVIPEQEPSESITTTITKTTAGILLQEPSEIRTTTTPVIPSKDKGKGIMVEDPLKMKKKDQDKVETDYELAQRLQVEEQEELTIEENSKRAGDELESNKSKKKKLDEKVEAEVDDAKEAEELKQCLEIVPDDGDEVTINATPLSVKIPIVDYKIYKEGKKSFFQIIRADGNSQMYLTFIKMLKNFDREDLEVLWKIVKARFKKTKPVNCIDEFLLLNLKTMFEHYVEDSVWKEQQGLVKVLNWNLFYYCGVYCVTVQSISYYLLVEKKYPLTNHTLHQMFHDVKLQVDYECEMAYKLLRLVKKQLKEGYLSK